MRFGIIIIAMLTVLGAGRASAQGETALTRGCRAVALVGDYLGADGKKMENVAVDVVWGTPSATDGKNAVVLKMNAPLPTAEMITLTPSFKFFRKDKDVNREGHYETGVAVMLGDLSRSYFRFCSYFIDDDRSAAYLELGKVVAEDGKENMSREGVLIIRAVDFVNVAGPQPRTVVKDFDPTTHYYTNALWSFFDRMYKAYMRK